MFHAVLVVATFLCALVAGLLFAFAVVVMPGIGRLDDGGFIRAFQAIDRVIQNNQPLFMSVWVGSVLALISATVLGRVCTQRRRSPAHHRRRASVSSLCAVPDFRHQRSPEQPDSEAGPRLDERGNAKACAGGIRAPVEQMERHQDLGGERSIDRIDASADARVSAGGTDSDKGRAKIDTHLWTRRGRSGDGREAERTARCGRPPLASYLELERSVTLPDSWPGTARRQSGWQCCCRAPAARCPDAGGLSR